MKCLLLAIAFMAYHDDKVWEKCTCLKEECAWWNDHFGICSQAVDAFLKGQEDWRREREIIRKGG